VTSPSRGTPLSYWRAVSQLPTLLGIVPARAGSKRLPGKNLRPLLGEPLIAHTIRSAQAARSVARTIVSTDSEAIAAVARELGAEVAMRPAELATDASPTEDALLHVVATLEVRGEELPDYVATLEPTSPLRTAQLIDECARLAGERAAGAVITVVETHDVFGRFDGDRFVFLEEVQPWRRLDRRPVYRNSSTVYLTRTELLKAQRSVICEPLHALVVPHDVGVDIDSIVEFELAEALLRRRQGEA
jgi:CMP-N,N'-diacetyllegionaminic acid synthase